MLAQILRDLFVKPIPITGFWRLGMLVPLALSISIVYKTIRCKELRSVPLASLTLCFTILFFMLLIGGGLLVLFQYLA